MLLTIVEAIEYTLFGVCCGFLIGAVWKGYLYDSYLLTKVNDTAIFIRGDFYYLLSAKKWMILQGWTVDPDADL